MHQTPELFVIQGIMKNGRAFRPSDWAERLCGVLGSFDADERLRYADDVQPTLIDGVRCVLISAQLPSINPVGFRFLMDFARDNDLRVLLPENARNAVATSVLTASEQSLATA